MIIDNLIKSWGDFLCAFCEWLAHFLYYLFGLLVMISFTASILMLVGYILIPVFWTINIAIKKWRL